MNATDFGSIYQRHSADVFRFALYLCGNRADAEDILSETFTRAWTSPAEIRVARGGPPRPHEAGRPDAPGWSTP